MISGLPVAGEAALSNPQLSQVLDSVSNLQEQLEAVLKAGGRDSIPYLALVSATHYLRSARYCLTTALHPPPGDIPKHAVTQLTEAFPH